MQLKDRTANWVVSVLAVIVFTFALGCGGGGGGGSTPTPQQTTLGIPLADPSAILANQQTTITITTFVTGTLPDTIELYLVENGSLSSKIGDMKDDGTNGDSVIGDHVYTDTYQTTSTESANITLRIISSTGGVQNTKDILLYVVSIPVLATNADFNQTASDVFSKTNETRTLITQMKQNPDNISTDSFLQLGNNLLNIFSGFEAITKQYVGFDIFNFAEQTYSDEQKIKIFKDYGQNSQTDPQVAEVVPLFLSQYGSEADLVAQDSNSQSIRELCAKTYYLNNDVLPSAANIAFKAETSQFTDLATDNIGQLFNLGSMITKGLQEASGIIIGWFMNNNKSHIVVGQVNENEQFDAPEGTYNLFLSNGGNYPRSMVLDIPVMIQKNSDVDFSNSTSIYPNHASWRMIHHDARNTGRSPLNGPVTNSLKREINISEEAQYIAEDNNGFIYVAEYGSGQGGMLESFDLNGNKIWSFQLPILDEINGPISIGNDNTVYFFSSISPQKLYALNSIDGSVKGIKIFDEGNISGNGIVISLDGKLYFVMGYVNKLYSLNPDLSENWNVHIWGDCAARPAVTVDGSTIYVYSGSGWTDSKLEAYNRDGTLKWYLQVGSLVARDVVERYPVIGDNGYVYVTGYSKVFAVNPSGELVWGKDLSNICNEPQPAQLGKLDIALAPDSSIIVLFTGDYGEVPVTPKMGYVPVVASLNPIDGSIKWYHSDYINISTTEPTNFSGWAGPIISNNSIIYVIYSTESSPKILFGFNSNNGAQLFELSQEWGVFPRNLAIGLDDSLLMGVVDGYIPKLWMLGQ